MHSNGAKHTVIDDDEDDRSAELHSCCQFLPEHHKAAIAIKAENVSIRCRQLGRDGSWNTVSHGATCWGNLSSETAVLEETMDPNSVIPGTNGQDGLVIQGFIQITHDL